MKKIFDFIIFIIMFIIFCCSIIVNIFLIIVNIQNAQYQELKILIPLVCVECIYGILSFSLWKENYK